MLSACEIDRVASSLPDQGEFAEWKRTLHLFRDHKPARWVENDDLLWIGCEREHFTRCAVETFIACGWSLHVFTDTELAVLGPMQFVRSPETCYHATPKQNIEGIDQLGILRGIDARQTTTCREDSGYYIHVSFTRDDAVAWATGDQLLAKSHKRQFAIWAINMREIRDKVYKDPCSGGGTGYIVNVPKIERRWLSDEPQLL